MSLFSHLRDPLSLNPKSQWLEFTSNYPEWSSHVQASIVESSSGESLSLASKILLLPSCTAIIADAFRPLLLDLCARWLKDSEALEDKLSALCLLLQPHTEIFPYVPFIRLSNGTLT
jgi:midasin